MYLCIYKLCGKLFFSREGGGGGGVTPTMVVLAVSKQQVNLGARLTDISSNRDSRRPFMWVQWVQQAGKATQRNATQAALVLFLSLTLSPSLYLAPSPSPSLALSRPLAPELDAPLHEGQALPHLVGGVDRWLPVHDREDASGGRPRHPGVPQEARRLPHSLPCRTGVRFSIAHKSWCGFRFHWRGLIWLR